MIYEILNIKNLEMIVIKRLRHSTELDGWPDRTSDSCDQQHLGRIHSCKSLHHGDGPQTIRHAVQCSRCVCCQHRNLSENAMTNDEQKKSERPYERNCNQTNTMCLTSSSRKLTLLSTPKHRLGLDAIQIPDQDDHRLHRTSFLVDFYIWKWESELQNACKKTSNILYVQFYFTWMRIIIGTNDDNAF